MKFNLSHTEAQNLIRSHFSLPSNVEVVIGRKNAEEKDELADLPSNVANLICWVDANHKANRVSAVKKVREFSGHGLRESLAMVDNWNQVRPILIVTHKLPSVRCDFGKHPVFTPL